MLHWTPIQGRIIELLSDGQYHRQPEVLTCLGDPEADLGALRAHLVKIREKLRPIGEEISTDRSNGNTRYRHVRIVTSGE